MLPPPPPIGEKVHPGVPDKMNAYKMVVDRWVKSPVWPHTCMRAFHPRGLPRPCPCACRVVTSGGPKGSEEDLVRVCLPCHHAPNGVMWDCFALPPRASQQLCEVGLRHFPMPP
jgi:hypothetical protein